MRLTLVAGFVTLLAACAGSSESSAAPDTAADLDGRAFVVTTLTGFDPVAGTTISINFDAGTIGVEAGCNGQSGRYAVEGEVLVVEDLFTTEIGCDAARHAQDQFLADFLTARPTIRVEGDTLTLRDDVVQIAATDRVVVDPDLPIVGTHWVLDTIVDGDTVSSVPEGVEAFVDFDDESNLSVFDGCNEGSGPVEVGDGELQLGTIGSTRKGCGEAAQLVGDALGRVLMSGTAVPFEVDGDRLTISNDERGLVFRAT